MTSLLAEFHNSITTATGAAEGSAKFNISAANQYDFAGDTAIELLAEAGLDHDDKDSLGNPVSDTVQTLLTLAFHLAPNLQYTVQLMIEERP